MRRPHRLALFAAICGVAALGVALPITRALRSDPRRASEQGSRPAADVPTVLSQPPDRPFLMFTSLVAQATWGRVGVAPLGSLQNGRYISELKCDRVYYATPRGVCLLQEEALTPAFTAKIFDAGFNVLHTWALTGLPSRARVSPDGRVAAITVFEQGHAYTDSFSTRTTLVDTFTGRLITELEQFTVSRRGERFRAPDFNFWGVTFARDSDRFFATLGSGGERYLVEGSIRAREAHVVVPGVECPSLSPDNRHIVFKRRVKREGAGWQLWVLDRQDSSERRLAAQVRSVDDQVEWLDDTHVLYFEPTEAGNNIMVLRTDADEPPSVLLEEAMSPSVVR
jgi:hypothetical protein